MEGRWKRAIRGLYSASVFALSISFLFQSWEIALVVTLGLGFHELGHILVVHGMGIDWEFGFSFLGAWTKTPLERRQTLGHFANSLIHLAGPFFSFLLATLALVIFFLIEPQSRSFLWPRLANFSVLLAVTNLLPMGSLSDAGKVIKRVFASLPQQPRRRLLTNLLPMLVGGMAHLRDFDEARAVSLLILLLWFAASLLLESRQDEPSEAESPKVMTEQQSGILLSGIIILVLYCYVIAIITPFWLTPDDVLHVIYAFEAAILYLILDSPMALKAGIILAVLLSVVLFSWAIGKRIYDSWSQRNNPKDN